MASHLVINARTVDPAIVAESFIPPNQFERIASRNHVVIVGARGSGKTTLLSMLTAPAQRIWLGGRGQGSEPLDYIGILVRADLTMSRQIRRQRVLLREQLDEEAVTSVLTASYCLNAVRSITRYVRDALYNIPGRPEGPGNQKSLDSDRTLAQSLARLSSIERNVGSLSELKLEVELKLGELWMLARRRRFGELATHSALDIDLFHIATAVAGLLPDHGLPGSIALLLDELELVPREVRTYLRTGLRDLDEHVLLKMSTSPVEDVVRSVFLGFDGNEGQDFLPIDLSYSNKSEAYGFSEALLLELGRSEGLVFPSIRRMLGRSHFDRADTQSRTEGAYGPTSTVQRRMQELATVDRSFEDYLKRNNLSLDRLNSMAESDRARHIRKIRDVVLVRSEYLRGAEEVASPASDRPTRRRHLVGPKSLNFYSGGDSIMALLEGNPRWMVNFILAASKAGATQRTFAPGRQANALAEVMLSVRSRIHSSPVSIEAETEADPSRGAEILELVDRIGRFFRSRVLGATFDPEPPLSFYVDDGVPRRVRELVSDGVSHGAFVRVVGRDSKAGAFDVWGERFRLAYLLGARWQLPPILGRPIHLSSILDHPMRDVDVTDPSDMRLFE